MNESIQNRIRDRSVGQVIVPFFNSQLTGNDDTAKTDSFFNDFEQFLSAAGIHRRDAKVIQNEHTHFGHFFQIGQIKAVHPSRFYFSQ